MEHFTFVKRGYDPEEVDKYITTLEQVIKSYKDKDNYIKNTMISAQMTADNVVKNAQAEAESYKIQIGEQLVGMRGTLDRQRASLQNFQRSLDLSDMFARIDEMDAAIAALQGLETAGREGLKAAQAAQDVSQRGYARDPMPEAPPMRDPIMRDPMPEFREREYMREPAPPREPSRDVMRQPGPYDQVQVHDMGRDMRGHDDPYRDNMRGSQDMMRPARDIAPPPHEFMRDSGDMMGMQPNPRERDAMYGDMRDQSQDMPRDTGRNYPQEPPREIIRDTRPRSDFGHDIRRDAGRDMRGDTGRDARRDDYSVRDGSMGRLDSREPRDMNRFYPPSDKFDDSELKLLPPVRL